MVAVRLPGRCCRSAEVEIRLPQRTNRPLAIGQAPGGQTEHIVGHVLGIEQWIALQCGNFRVLDGKCRSDDAPERGQGRGWQRIFHPAHALVVCAPCEEGLDIHTFQPLLDLGLGQAEISRETFHRHKRPAFMQFEQLVGRPWVLRICKILRHVARDESEPAGVADDAVFAASEFDPDFSGAHRRVVRADEAFFCCG